MKNFIRNYSHRLLVILTWPLAAPSIGFLLPGTNLLSTLVRASTEVDQLKLDRPGGFGLWRRRELRGLLGAPCACQGHGDDQGQHYAGGPL